MPRARTKRSKSKKDCLTKCEKKGVKNIVKRMLDANISDKYFYSSNVASSVAAVSIASDGTAYANIYSGYFSAEAIAPVPLGPEQQEQVGCEIRPKYCDFYYNFAHQTAASGFQRHVLKIYLIRYKMPTPASSFNITQCFETDAGIVEANPNASNWITSAFSPQCHVDPDFAENYKVVKTRTLIIEPETSTAVVNKRYLVKFRYRFPKRETWKSNDDASAWIGHSYRIVIFSSAGNKSSINASSLGIPQTWLTGEADSQTGIVFTHYSRMVYEDA